MPAEPVSLSRMRRDLARWLRNLGAEDEEAFDIIVSCNEAAANAVEHAIDPAACSIHIDGSCEEAEITIVVRDSGRWREPVESDRGRGLTLMRNLMDSLQVNPTRSGTEVCMTRRLRTVG
ncbi:MAG: ATP-binding protein [Actinobacteria bacterium]|nr:ATP-binding protein [Actinomycetota bacterium]